jgi:hypothetical protein
MTTWTQKHNIKTWVEEKLYDAVEKILPEGFEIGFSGSRVSESAYLSIGDGTDTIVTIRISDHFKGYRTNDEITILMSDGEKMRTKTDIKKEVMQEVRKALDTY